ncbi:MAG: N-acetylmuramoyl-L-alanine amidase [Anaerolineales bacterium]|nr:MAG: N-acetylmuramoyl-L-alanine amidase [Anaerolineales bacterium]
MAVRTCRVGLHGRNQEFFEEMDYRIIREARIETLKMMSQTRPEIFQRIKNENPGIEFIVRLWDDRMGVGRHPTPEQFVERMAPIVEQLRPFVTKFEIHNEPNHLHRYEGWGQEDADARDFNEWYQRVFKLLKARCPWALLGFPGLAIPHRDLEWVEICRPSVEMSDFLGVHCYWQTTVNEPRNHLADFWGLRFKYYHDKFPNKVIDLLEMGNSNAQSNLPITNIQIAQQYVEYFQELFKYPYINSGSPFILSSPDSTWDSFAWRTAGGGFKPVVAAIGGMFRPTLTLATAKPPVRERFFELTQQTVSGPFLDFFDKYGLDICGYPVSPLLEEDGLPAQYFQRVVLEEFQPGQIRLRLAGAQVLDLRKQVRKLDRLVALARASGALPVAPEPPISDISDTLAHHATESYPSRDESQIDSIVIHHTALPASVGPQQIATVLVRDRQMAGIAYHYFIGADGTISQTQPLTTLTGHAYQFSNTSLGIAFAGNFTDMIPTTQQLEAGGALCAYLMDLLNISRDKIKGLSELVAHQSPGQQWLEGQKWRDLLMAQIDLALSSIPAPLPPLGEQVVALQARITELEQQLAAAQANGQLAALQARITDLEQQLAAALAQGQPGTRVVTQPTIKNVTDQLPKHATDHYATRALSQIKVIVLHHSAVPASVGAERIAKYQVERQGWPGAGFHYFIYDDGRIEQTQPLEIISYHAGDANPVSVGVCLGGNFTDQPPTEAQLLSTSQLTAWLLQELNLPMEAIHPHKDYVITACPGDQWDNGAKWEDVLRQQVQDALAGAGPVVTTPAGKSMGHYVLFWQTQDAYAQEDLLGAQNYIGRFRVTVGFSLDDAMHAEYVTIVGGPLGVSSEAEALLRAAGCRVERIAGDTIAETKALLDQMAADGRRFMNF